MNSTNPVTHYGHNYTHRGHWNTPNAWIPVEYIDGNPHFVGRGLLGAVAKVKPLREHLLEIVENTSRLNRIWLRMKDGTTRCVFWYEQGVLDELV